MKYWLLTGVFLLYVAAGGNAQSVLNQWKDKVESHTDQHLDEGAEKMEDKVMEKRKQCCSAGERCAAADTLIKDHIAKDNTNSFQSYSRYDFVPGNRIVFAEDFIQDAVGEFPLHWTTNNRGEVVTSNSNAAKWLRLYQEGHYVTPLINKLPENFTLEFDLILQFDHGGDAYVYPEFLLKLLQLQPRDGQAKDYLLNDNAQAEVSVTISPGEEGSSTLQLKSQRSGNDYFENDKKEFKRLESNYGKPMHFALWVQKERLRLWINEEKVYDIPRAVPPQSLFNRLGFVVSSSNYADEQIGVYIGNIKVTEGSSDLRSKLLTEGKLVTNGILFDLNSDVVKPQSAGVLREITAVFKENPSLSVRIAGHTDSEGNEALNLDLSRRRAASVKAVLIKEFGIAADRLEAEGLGETKPLADNATREGRAQNRRVEFIKL